MFDSWLSFSSVIRLYISWLGKYQSENEKQLCSSWPGTSGKLICQSCCSHFPVQPVPRWRFLSPNRPKSTILCWNTKENYNNLWITGYERDHLKSFDYIFLLIKNFILDNCRLVYSGKEYYGEIPSTHFPASTHAGFLEKCSTVS